MYHLLLAKVAEKETENVELLQKLEKLPMGPREELEQRVQDLSDELTWCNRRITDDVIEDRNYDSRAKLLQYRLQEAKRAAEYSESPEALNKNFKYLSGRLEQDGRLTIRLQEEINTLKRRAASLTMPQKQIKKLRAQYDALNTFLLDSGEGHHRRGSDGEDLDCHEIGPLSAQLEVLRSTYDELCNELLKVQKSLKFSTQSKQELRFAELECRIVQEEIGELQRLDMRKKLGPPKITHVEQEMTIEEEEREIFTRLHDIDAQLARIYDPPRRLRDLRFIAEELPKQIGEMNTKLSYIQTESKLMEEDMRNELEKVNEEYDNTVVEVETLEQEVLELKQQHGLAEARIQFTPPDTNELLDTEMLTVTLRKTEKIKAATEVIMRAVRLLRLDSVAISRRLECGLDPHGRRIPKELKLVEDSELYSSTLSYGADSSWLSSFDTDLGFKKEPKYKYNIREDYSQSHSWQGPGGSRRRKSAWSSDFASYDGDQSGEEQYGYDEEEDQYAYEDEDEEFDSDAEESEDSDEEEGAESEYEEQYGEEGTLHWVKKEKKKKKQRDSLIGEAKKIMRQAAMISKELGPLPGLKKGEQVHGASRAEMLEKGDHIERQADGLIKKQEQDGGKLEKDKKRKPTFKEPSELEDIPPIDYDVKDGLSSPPSTQMTDFVSLWKTFQTEKIQKLKAASDSKYESEEWSLKLERNSDDVSREAPQKRDTIISEAKKIMLQADEISPQKSREVEEEFSSEKARRVEREKTNKSTREAMIKKAEKIAEDADVVVKKNAERLEKAQKRVPGTAERRRKEQTPRSDPKKKKTRSETSSRTLSFGSRVPLESPRIRRPTPCVIASSVPSDHSNINRRSRGSKKHPERKRTKGRTSSPQEGLTSPTESASMWEAGEELGPKRGEELEHEESGEGGGGESKQSIKRSRKKRDERRVGEDAHSRGNQGEEIDRSRQKHEEKSKKYKENRSQSPSLREVSEKEGRSSKAARDRAKKKKES